MKPAPFDYVRAESLAEAHDVLAAEGSDAAVIAGGQSLVPLLSMRMARPSVVVDIMHVDELGGISIEDNCIRVGATVRQAELLAWPDLAKHQPLLGAGAAVGRARADARAGHGVRLGRACRSECGVAAGARGARRKHRSFVEGRAAQREGGGFLFRHHVDGTQR